MGVNKFVYSGQTKFDITDTTATAETVLEGYTAYGADGNKFTGMAVAGSTVVISDSVDEHGGIIRSIFSDGVTRLQPKSVTPTESAQSIVPDTGYRGLSQVNVGAIPSDYIGSGITRQSAKTVTPTTSQQIAVEAGSYTTGNVTVSPIPSDYIIPSGNLAITENGTNINVRNYSTVSVDVSGSGGMNVQAYHGMDYARATSYTATDVSLTVAVTGTYKVSWMGFRNTNSGTNGSQLYVNGTARGSAYTTFTSTYGQSVVQTGISLNKGDVLVVRARSRSTSYYMYVGNLIIEQTS